MRFAIYTLGCKVNQYETQAMETVLTERGHTLTDFEEPAEVYIINTCSVTAVSDKKCRNIIRRARRTHPDALIAVCGCYAQASPDDVKALGVDLVAGTNQRMAFLNKVERAVMERTQDVSVDDAIHRKEDFEVLPAGGLVGRTRALMKVEDGCSNFCSYCIIPFTRGPVRSQSLAAAVEQAKELAAAGYQEIVVTGIEISSWGRDLEGEKTLIDLLEALCAAVPTLRIRMGSLEPRTITEEFCRRAALLPNLCPHFHLSLQSGCDATLKRMNRRYDSARFLLSCELLRRYFPDCAITTDMICGFVGETEEEFDKTLAFIQQADFAAMHIFPYSIRSGTAAHRMKGHLPQSVKEERCRRASAVAAEMEQRYLASWVGKTVSVLFEETCEGQPCGVGLWRGHAPSYVQVCAEGEDLHNCLRQVRILSVEGNRLMGEIV